MAEKDFPRTLESNAFSQGIAFALKKLRRPLLKLNNEQHACIEALMTGTYVFSWLPTDCKSLWYQALPFVYDYMVMDRPDNTSMRGRGKGTDRAIKPVFALGMASMPSVGSCY